MPGNLHVVYNDSYNTADIIRKGYPKMNITFGEGLHVTLNPNMDLWYNMDKGRKQWIRTNSKLEECGEKTEPLIAVKTRAQDYSLNHGMLVLPLAFSASYSWLLSMYFTPLQHLIRSYCLRH